MKWGMNNTRPTSWHLNKRAFTFNLIVRVHTEKISLSIPSYLYSCQHITHVQSDVILVGERRQNTELGKTIVLTQINLKILFYIEMGKWSGYWNFPTYA